MPVLQATSITDTLVNSLNNLDRLKMTDLMSNYPNTIALKRIFKKKPGMQTISDGPEMQFNAIIDTNGSARHVPLAYVANTNVPNVLINGKMPWRHTTWNYAMERRLVAMNAGNAKIIDVVESQRLAAAGAAVALFERTLWRVPDATTEYDLNPVGIPYFVVKSGTEFTTTNQGITGTVPTGYTLVANINPTTYPRYANYGELYAAISQDDLIDKMCRAQFYTDWTPLVEGIKQHDTGNDYGIYTNYAVTGALRKILNSQNDDLGPDVATYEGKATFMRSPFEPVIELDADTTNPVYMLNWGCLGAMRLKGEWMKEKYFPEQANQPTMMMWNIDCTWNMWCTNRRKQAVLATATTMPS